MTGQSVWALLNTYYAVLRETAFRTKQINFLSPDHLISPNP
jgi:hypothetical protein